MCMCNLEHCYHRNEVELEAHIQLHSDVIMDQAVFKLNFHIKDPLSLQHWKIARERKSRNTFTPTT